MTGRKTNLSLVPVAIVISLFSRLALAAGNNWDVPCHDGQCYYENDHASITLSGPAKSISDLTNAGGWTILDCDPNTTDQAIRLVCHDDSETGCGHVDVSASAGNQIVRLPESCGSGPFARISRAWVSQDQQVPDSVMQKLAKRAENSPMPEVMGMQLDTNFEEMDSNETGELNFSIQGFNIKGLASKLASSQSNSTDQVPAGLRRSRIARFGLPNIQSRGIFDGFDINKINIDDSQALPHISKTISVPLFDQTVSCSDSGPIAGSSVSGSASIKASIDVTANADVTVGVVAKGTILPPKLSEFGLLVGMNAEFDGSLSLTGDAQATIDSGKQTLVEIPIDGITLKGIIDIGPSLQLNAQATATMDINASAKVGLSYKVDNAQFVFPRNDKDTSGFGPADNAVSLSVSPGAESKASVSAHLIPTLNLGLNVLKIGANVFVDLDAGSTAELTLKASAAATTILTSSGPTSTTPDSTASASSTSSESAGLSQPPASSSIQMKPMSSSIDYNSTTAQSAEVSITTALSSMPPSSSAADSSSESALLSVTPSSSVQEASSSVLSGSASGESSSISETKSVLRSTDSSQVSEAPSPSSASAEPAPSTTTAPKGEISQKLDSEVDSDTAGYESVDKRSDPAGDVDGCVDVFTQLDVNIGADASFFGLFDKSTKLNLFSKKFDLFKKCFGDSQPPAKRSRSLLSASHRAPRSPAQASVRMESSLSKRALTCLPSSGSATSALVSLVEEIVPASKILGI